MADRGGSQCGYCTPGFVCAMAAEYYRPDRTPTGRTERVAAAEPDADGDGAPRPGGNGQTDPTTPRHRGRPRARPQRLRPARPQRQPLPLHRLPAIRDAAYALPVPGADRPAARDAANSRRPPPVATRIASAHGTFVRPATLAEALDLLADEPDAQLVAGSTDWGVELNLRHARARLSIGIDRLAELRRLEVTDERIDIGAALTLSEVERGLAGRVPLLDALFPQFASRLIRNGATLGGNLGTGSPIGDAIPALLALDCTLVLASATVSARWP